jgi:hypothetical protein
MQGMREKEPTVTLSILAHVDGIYPDREYNGWSKARQVDPELHLRNAVFEVPVDCCVELLGRTEHLWLQGGGGLAGDMNLGAASLPWF